MAERSLVPKTNLPAASARQTVSAKAKALPAAPANAIPAAPLSATPAASATPTHSAPVNAISATPVVQQRSAPLNAGIPPLATASPAQTAFQLAPALSSEPIPAPSENISVSSAPTPAPSPFSMSEKQPQSSQPIQRKTGFELELDVPAYIEPPEARMPKINKEVLDATEAKQVQSFLGGGLEYSFVYGIQRLGYYNITADHNHFGTAHRELVNGLMAKRLIDPDFIFRDMTNLEYVTPPFTEGSATLLENVANAIKDHAVDTASKSATDGRVELIAPAKGLFTGVPVSALLKLVEGEGDLIGKVNSLNSKFQKNIYYQESTGVLPSEIPALFKEGVEDIGKNQKDKLENPRDNPRIYAKTKLLEFSAATGEGIVLPETIPVKYTAPFKGYFTLVAQYLMASQLEKFEKYQGGTDKNKLSYLSRVPLEQTRNALPEGFEEHLGTAWNSIKARFKETINGYVQQIKDATGFREEKGEPEVLGTDPATNLENVIAGRPAVTVRPGSALKPQNVYEEEGGGVKTGEKLIALEDREMGAKTTASEKTVAKVSETLMARWGKAFQRRQGALDDDTKDALARYTKGQHGMIVLVEILEYLLPEESRKIELQVITGFIGSFSTFLDFPDQLAEEDVFKAAEPLFPSLAALRDQVAIAVGEEAKKQLCETFLMDFLEKEVAPKIEEAFNAKYDDDNRALIHETVEQTRGNVRGKAIDKNNWEPDITDETIEETVHYFVTLDSGQPAVIAQKEDFAIFMNGETPALVLRVDKGVTQKLRYSSLPAAEYVWVNI